MWLLFCLLFFSLGEGIVRVPYLYILKYFVRITFPIIENRKKNSQERQRSVCKIIIKKKLKSKHRTLQYVNDSRQPAGKVVEGWGHTVGDTMRTQALSFQPSESAE
jgi:hypothetical protein